MFTSYHRIEAGRIDGAGRGERELIPPRGAVLRHIPHRQHVVIRGQHTIQRPTERDQFLLIALPLQDLRNQLIHYRALHPRRVVAGVNIVGRPEICRSVPGQGMARHRLGIMS